MNPTYGAKRILFTCTGCGAARRITPTVSRLKKTTLCARCSSSAIGRTYGGYKPPWVIR